MSKARIMVVEDEGVVALQIRECLEGLGYAVPLVAMSGEEALEKLRETEPDLVLMDIKLPGRINGIEATRRIQGLLDVPVVYLTAFSDAETLALAENTDSSGYVLKPFEERSLNAAIQMSLAKHRRSREARENAWWMTAVAESMMEAVLICDVKGYVKFINPSAEALIGRRDREVREKRLHDIVRLVDAQRHTVLPFPVTEPLFEGKSTLRGNCALVVGDGAEIPVEFSASPLRSPEGTLFGILYVLRQTGQKEQIQARVLKEMQDLARLQRRTLPSSETVIPGYRCEWLFLPAAFGGGDAVGFMRLDDERLAVYCLEVAGEGILSALFSVLLRTFLTPHFDRGGVLVEKTLDWTGRRVLTPAEVVRALNARFYLRDDSNPYFTLAYGVVERATGKMSLVRAGHPSPIHQRADGSLELISPAGVAIGVDPGADTPTAELVLEKGDRLFLYTNGLTDCPSPNGERYGDERLARLISEGRAAGLKELTERAGAEVHAWHGSDSFADDISLLALERE